MSVFHRLNRRWGVVLFLSTMLLVSCSNEQDDASEKIVSDQAKESIPEGVDLELRGVDPSLEGIFTDYFPAVAKAHQQMIARETEDTKKLFPENRPDLGNAKLVYDAEKNQALYIFYYEPKPGDISITEHAMIMESATYMYIQNALVSYFANVKKDLQANGIPFQSPRLAYKFEKHPDEYLLVTFSLIDEFEALIHTKLAEADEEVVVAANFVTGPVKLAVLNPLKTLEGANSKEAALLKFFNVDYGQLTSDNNSGEELLEQEDNKESQPPPLALPKLKERDPNIELQVQDFEAAVNKHSVEQVETSLLHRPVFEETAEGYKFTYNTGHPDDVVIATDKQGSIKRIEWKSSQPLTEEYVLHLQWLLSGLDSSIELEELNTFLFSEQLPVYGKFGGFNVGLAASTEGFLFVVN